MTGLIVALAVVAGVLFIVAFMGIRIIRPYQKGLVERLGKYQRTADSGLTFIIPFFEIITKVDIREQVEGRASQAVILQDNLVVSGRGGILRVTDPYKFAYTWRTITPPSPSCPDVPANLIATSTWTTH